MFKRKKVMPKRKYHDGDVIEFNFRPHSLDVEGDDVILTGVVSGVLYDNDYVRYKIQLRDNNRDIHGDIIVPENQINRKIE